MTKADHIRLATFNANSIRSRLDVILHWLATYKPDVLCIQETKAQDVDFPAEPIRAAGYHVVFKGEKSYNGVALISTEAARDVQFGLDDGGPADETRLVTARFGDIAVINTYVPQGRELDHAMFAYKLEWYARLRRFFERHFQPSEPVLWTGDLNIAAEPIDVHSPQDYTQHVCFHESARKAFAACRAWGFEDVFRHFHPEAEQYSFFDYRTPNAVKRKIGWRLDYLLATPPLAQRAVASAIDIEPRLQAKASDHTFVYADFRTA